MFKLSGKKFFQADLNENFCFPNSNDTAPYSLHLINPKLCSFNKLHVNINIVVVGASRTALSFFENLIFGYFWFHIIVKLSYLY